MRLLPLTIVAALLAAPGSASASANDFAGHHVQVRPVVVVHGLGLDALPALARRGAVGLLVPSAGPRTSAQLSFAGIVRGVLHNARLGAKPDGPVLIRVGSVDSLAAVPSRAIVLGLPPQRLGRNDARYPIAVLGGCRGILTSALTRVPGLVSAADVARTALAARHSLGCRTDPHAPSTLRRLEQRIEVTRGTTMGATVLVLSLLLLLALVLPSATLPALAATLAANLGLGIVPAGSVTARLTLLGLCVVAGGILGRRLVARVPAVAGGGLLGLVAAHAVAMAVEPSSLSLAPIGPELTSRFFGVSNALETLLLVPGLAGTALLARRFGPPAFLLGAVLTLVTIAENRFGADGGGAIVVAVAFAVLAIGMTRARARTVAPALLLAGAAAFALVSLDAATTSPDHLRGALAGGVGGIAAALAHRVPLAYARIASQWYLVFPLAALTLLAARTRHAPVSRDRRALVAALAAGVVTSLLVNDSPGPVTLTALGAFVALEPQSVRREVGRLASRLLDTPRPTAATITIERQ